MLKFSVSKRSLDLPVNYLRDTCRKSLRGLKHSKSMVVFRNSEFNQPEFGTEPQILDSEIDDNKQTDINQNPPPNLLRSVSTRMQVWTNQLSRLKKKTDTLRRKDVEIRERYQQLKKKAKLVTNSRSQYSPSRICMDEATPVKRQKMETRPAMDTFYVTNESDQSNLNQFRATRKIPTSRQNISSENKPIPKRAFCFVESPNRGLVPVGWRKILSLQRRHKSESSIPSRNKTEGQGNREQMMELSPVPYPRTFLKDGKKCTFC